MTARFWMASDADWDRSFAINIRGMARYDASLPAADDRERRRAIIKHGPQVVSGDHGGGQTLRLGATKGAVNGPDQAIATDYNTSARIPLQRDLPGDRPDHPSLQGNAWAARGDYDAA